MSKNNSYILNDFLYSRHKRKPKIFYFFKYSLYHSNRNKVIFKELLKMSTNKLQLLGKEGVISNYRRGRHTINLKQNILIFPEITTRTDAKKLIGRTVVWQSPTGKELKGIIKRAHGNSGAVRAQFKKAGLPGQALGQKIKIIK